MKIELHLLQSVPPANLNRDDTGAPKDAEFGGHRRARLSSQSLKRAIRTSDVFERLVSERTGVRTRRLATRVAKSLVGTHSVDEPVARALAEGVAEALTNKKFESKKALDAKGQTSVLYYGTYPEFDDLAERLAEAASNVEAETGEVADANAELEALGDRDDENAKAFDAAEKTLRKARTALGKKLLKSVVTPFVKAHKDVTSAPDVALFGRFLAEEPQLNLEAACQVAHALSVDRVAPQFDYFTAVDDLKSTAEADDAGAAMIGTTGFNAACYYRYAVIDADALAENLGGDREAARDTVRAFLTAAVTALPSGKQNSFAAQVRPELVMAVVRHDRMPLSLVNAFADPVRTNGRSMAYHAAEKLAEHWVEMEAMYAGLLPDEQAPAVFVSTPHRDALPADGPHSLDTAWCESVRAVIDGVIETMEVADA